MTHDALGFEPGPSKSQTAVIPRTIDLYGRIWDGRPMLWKREVQVVPIITFECNGRWIRSGHYVIDHNGDAIVVHCGNMGDSSISVQFMYEERRRTFWPVA